MSKYTVIAVAVCVAAISGICFPYQKKKAKTSDTFVVYSDAGDKKNHYFPSGWMGDYGDIKLDYKFKDIAHSGETAIEVVYNAQMAQNKGWAGIYWQNPVNNWGNEKGGFDLRGFNKLTFWARGVEGGEVIQKVAVGGIKGVYSDSLSREIGPIELTSRWKHYTINLLEDDLSYVSGGFCVVMTADLNPDGAVFYIDDIKFEVDSSLKAEERRIESMPFYVYSDSGFLDNHYIPSGWMGDYSDIYFESGYGVSPYSGETCIKVVYDKYVSQGSMWAGIYWQNPANNWGELDRGFDLSQAVKLTFWARGENGGEMIDKFQAGGISGKYSDSSISMVGPVVLEKEWQQYTIDLTNKDTSYIIGGFCWAANSGFNSGGITFYLDEIKYE